jgi:hypothetical protein
LPTAQRQCAVNYDECDHIRNEHDDIDVRNCYWRDDICRLPNKRRTWALGCGRDRASVADDGIVKPQNSRL